MDLAEDMQLSLGDGGANFKICCITVVSMFKSFTICDCRKYNAVLFIFIVDQCTGVGPEPVSCWSEQDIFPCWCVGPPGRRERFEVDRHHCTVPGPQQRNAG